MGTNTSTAAGPSHKRHALALAGVCVTLGLISLLLLRPAVRVLTEYRAPTTPAEPAAEPGAALTGRVVLVVLSGVGVAELAANGDPWRFAQLRRRAGEGSYGAARAVQPSADLPTWVALLSGAGPAESGVGDTEGDASVIPSIFDRLRETGRRSAVVASEAAWKARAGLAEPDRLVVVPSSTAVGERAVDLLGEQTEALVVTLIDLGRLARFTGEERWTRVDQQFASIAGALDPTRDTLIATADHGLLRDGSSGGHEHELVDVPLVLWGRAILPGRIATMDQRDIPATVATLLGFSYPPHGGQPVLDALDLTEAARARVLTHLLHIRTANHLHSDDTLAAAVELLGEARRALSDGQPAKALAAAHAGLARLEQPAPGPWYWRSAAVWGLVVPLLLLGAARVLARFRGRLQYFKVPGAALLGYVGAWSAIYFGLAGKRLSLSAVYGNWMAALLEIAVLSGLALAAVAVVIGMWHSGGKAERAAILIGQTAGLVLLVLMVVAGSSLLAARSGAPGGAYLLASAIAMQAPSALPDFTAWTVLLLALAQATGVGLAAPAVMLLAATLADVTGRGR